MEGADVTLADLLAWHVAQRDAVAAYFDVADAKDGKTAKTYRKHVEEAQKRVDLLSKIMIDGYQVN